jgi:DNA (cytosine-5)-methyltransferase 1
MIWYEFFAGGGMARLGLGDGWKCAFANEWCPKKAAAYTRRFGSEELRAGDVAKLTTADLPGHADLAWASFPCQDLSLAGAGAGLKGARSGTFHAFWKLIDGLAHEGRAPRGVVLENVVGAITSHGGRDFAEILGRMAATGYSFGPLVLDAERWLPQSRPRLFVVGVRQAHAVPCRPAGMSWTCPTGLAYAYEKLEDALRERWIWWELPEPPGRTIQLDDLLERRVSNWHSEEQTQHLLGLMSDAHRRKVAAAGAGSVGTIYRRTRSDGQRAEVRFDGISGCLRTPAGGSSRQTVLTVGRKGVRSRLLTARETARLMGVPDDYPLPAKYNDAYHLFGDGVAVPVVRYLEERLLRPLLGPGARSSKIA